MNHFEDGLAEVEMNDKIGFVDKSGQEVVPLQYDYASEFSEGLALVRKNRKYGYVDKLGREVIPLQYEDANKFSDGFAWVKQGGKWGTIALPSVTADPTPPPADEPDDWAAKEVNEAIERGLVPTILQSEYKRNISRQDFCLLAVHFLTVHTGRSLESILSERIRYQR